MKKAVLVILLFALCSNQIALMGQTKTLSLDNTFDVIRKYHPIVKQTQISIENARAVLQTTRGLFDPSLYVTNERKTFDGKNYYNYTNPEISIPTWYGLNFKTGLEDNLGDRILPSLSPGKSTYAGVELPLLKGLLFDKRRAAVQQAKLFTQLTRQEQRLMVNDILFEAAAAYWKWTAASRYLMIFDQAVNINQKRFELTRTAFELGDRAAIDTTEALSQLQQILFAREQAWLSVQQSRLTLSNYLWNEDTPYELDESVQPDSAWNAVSLISYPLPELETALRDASVSHPKLNIIDVQMDGLLIDRKLKQQALLPTLNLKYNFLSSGYGYKGVVAAPLFNNNYRFGIQFGLPLFLREARGEYKSIRFKVADLDYSAQQTKLEIMNKVKISFNELLTYQKQVVLFESNLNNMKKLLDAEEQKFSIGESSIFLVNTRENKLLETQQKLAELKTKFFEALLKVQWATGQIQ